MLTVAVLVFGLFFFFPPPVAVSFRQCTEEERVSRLLQSGTTRRLFLILLEVLYPFAFSPHVISVQKIKLCIKRSYLKHVIFAVSKYLTLLIEIQPINNVRVLKAVDSCVRVQVNYSTNLNINLFNPLCIHCGLVQKYLLFSCDYYRDCFFIEGNMRNFIKCLM